MPRAQKRSIAAFAAASATDQPQHPSDQVTPLPSDFEPGPYDVICARGNAAAGHPGYVRYRHYIDQLLEEYNTQATTKLAKSMIVSRVVEFVRHKTAAGFVKQIQGRWYKVSDSFVREKIGQTFRDALHFKYRSSNKAKKCRKKEVTTKDEAKETTAKPRRFSSASTSANSDHTQEAAPLAVASHQGASQASKPTSPVATSTAASSAVGNNPALLREPAAAAAMANLSEHQKQQFALYQQAETFAQQRRLQQLQQQQSFLYSGPGFLGVQHPQQHMPASMLPGVSPHLLHSLRQGEAARLLSGGAGWAGSGAPSMYAQPPQPQVALSGPAPQAEKNKDSKTTPDGTDALIAALQQKLSSNESTASSSESATSRNETDAAPEPAEKKARLSNNAAGRQLEASLLGSMPVQQYGGLPGNVYVVMPGSTGLWQQKQHFPFQGGSFMPPRGVTHATHSSRANQDEMLKSSSSKSSEPVESNRAGIPPPDAAVVAASLKRVSAVSDEESVETNEEDHGKSDKTAPSNKDWLSKVQAVGEGHVVMPVDVFQELLRKLEGAPEAAAALCSSSRKQEPL